jgi:hypothetical protein
MDGHLNAHQFVDNTHPLRARGLVFGVLSGSRRFLLLHPGNGVVRLQDGGVVEGALIPDKPEALILNLIVEGLRH